MAELQPPSVDSITPPPPPAQKEAAPVADVVKARTKRALLLIVGTPYLLFILWCLFLMVALPGGLLPGFRSAGLMTVLGGVLVIVGVAGIGVMRVGKAVDLSERARVQGLTRIGLFVTPGLLIAVVTWLLAGAEPALPLGIKDPTDPAAFVAPVSVTFDVREAIGRLEQEGKKAVKLTWDFNGDSVVDQETVVPEATAYFERQGSYLVSARIDLDDGTSRRVSRSVAIPTAVFSIEPYRPIVDQPIRFSVEHLVTDEKILKEVQWDFDEDGEADQIGTELTAVYTYHRTGPVKVSVTVLLQTQVQNVYERVIQISEPEELPFPVQMVTEPEYLIGPPPLGTIFRIETEEPVSQILWNFGDGGESNGERVGHTFDRKGNFAVMAEVRSMSGEIARLTKLVQIVDKLNLTDLVFDGTPAVQNDKLSAEVPVTVDLRPRTSMPLIEFFWEAPEASSIGSKEGPFQAIYRRPGTYTITMLAKDPEGHALRRPLTLEVLPVQSLVSIKMTPDGGDAPLPVRFDASETVIPDKEVSGFEWYIGEEKTPRQGGAIFEHRFDAAGTYKVRVVARTTSGESFESTKTIVVRPPILDACFTASRTSGRAPLGVSFNLDCTTGTFVQVTWDFGDDSQSEERAPIHVFQTAGSYIVTLTVKAAEGTVSTQTLTITAE